MADPLPELEKQRAGLLVRIPMMSISHSDLMPITVPNYNRKTDRHQLGTLIGITQES
jgi:hypothetical protein